MLLDGPLTADALAARTGWEIKPEGACRGPICVPLPPLDPSDLDVEALAARLGMPLVEDAATSSRSLGPATVTGRALNSADLPPITLPDLEGNPFDLATLRGQKVLLVAWAPW